MDKKIRLKMLCSFSSSKDLCDEWKVICENEYQWKNFEITWNDHEIDYYIIINFPRPGEYFEKMEKSESNTIFICGYTREKFK